MGAALRVTALCVLAAPAGAQEVPRLDTLREIPADGELFEAMLDHYTTEAPDSLVAFLWKVWGLDMTIFSLEGAIRTLQSEDPTVRAHSEEALEVVAASLGEQFYDPVAFLGSPRGDELRALTLTADTLVRRGVRELLDWHEPKAGGWRLSTSIPSWGWPPANIGLATSSVSSCRPAVVRGEASGMALAPPSWWAARDTATDTLAVAPPPRSWWAVHDGAPDSLGLPPRTRAAAGSRLLRAMGRWYAETSDPGSAEGYFCLASFLTEDVHPQSFEDLVWLYVHTELVQPIALLYEGHEGLFHDRSDLRVVHDALLRPLHRPWWKSPWVWGPPSALAALCAMTRWIFDAGPCAGGGITGTVIVIP